MNFSFSFTSDPFDADIDDNMSTLYPNPIVLEKKCALSLLSDDIYITHPDQTVLNPTRILVDNKVGENDSNSNELPSPESVIKDLPPGYLIPSFDPIEDFLLSFPALDRSTVISYFMEKIEKADADKDIIVGHLAVMIDSNYSALMECIQIVHDIDLDLQKAGNAVMTSRRRINSASTIVKSGTIRIRDLSVKREKLLFVATMIRSIKALKDICKSLTTSLNTGEVGQAAEYAFHVLQALHDKSYTKFTALDTIRETTLKNVHKIRKKADKALNRVAGRKFAVSEYENIIHAYLVLDYLAETSHIKIFDGQELLEDDNLKYYKESEGCIGGLSQRINLFQLEDINACLHTSVMECIYASQQQKHKAAQQIDVAGAYTQMKMDEIVDIAEIPLNILYKKLSPAAIAPCVVRSCELLADIVHTQYMIMQWHACPFDPRNHDILYLHTNQNSLFSEGFNTDFDEFYEVDDESEGGDDLQTPREDAFTPPKVSDPKVIQPHGDVLSFVDEDEVKSPNFKKVKLKKSQTLLQHLIRHFRIKLGFLYQNLSRSRSVLWEELITAIVDMLNMLTFTFALKPEDFLAINWAIRSIIQLGKEVCGSESKALKNCMQDKFKEYVQHFHFESFQILRQLVEAETWLSVPINLNSVGGVLGIIQSSISRGTLKFFQPVTIITNEESQSILRLFATSGNPFQYLANRFEIGSTFNTSEDNSIQKNPSIDNGVHTTTSNGKLRRSSYGMKGSADDELHDDSGERFWKLLCASVDVNETVPDHSEETDPAIRSTSNDFLQQPRINLRSNHNNSDDPATSAMVVTQAALNGLSKCVAKYLHLMYLLPQSAPDLFIFLCQLFDFYLCSVFVGFVSTEERAKLLTPSLSNKMLADAPHQSRDFETLREYMERTLAEVVATGAGKRSNSSATTSTGLTNSSTITGFAQMTIQVGGDSVVSSTTSTSFFTSHIQGNVSESDGQTNTSSFESNGSPVQSSYEVVRMASLLRTPAVIAAADQNNFYALNERIVASESCWFVAKILFEMKDKISMLLPSRSVPICEQYVSSFQTVASQLRALIYKAICPQLMQYNQILSQIVDNSSWDVRKIRESNHDWVDQLVSNANEIWQYLLKTDQFAESAPLVREQVWLEICQAAFDVVLDGYSKVRRCSTEGRAAMTMDVFALHEGLNNIHLCRPPRGKPHIDDYLRTSYMTVDEDIMQWVQDHWQSYAYRHIHGLLTQTMSSVMNGKKFRDAISTLDALYESESKDKEGNSSASRFSNLINQRLGDEKKLSTMIAQKLRKKSLIG